MMINQRIPLGLYQAPNNASKGPSEGVFLINLEHGEVDQVVAMRVYLGASQHQLLAGTSSASSEGTP
jgi:hypothetical protein